MTVSARDVEVKTWWDVRAGKKERYKRSEDYAERLRELLERSIAATIDTDLKIGSHVSGGIDSTAVTCVAQQQLRAQNIGLAKTYAWAPGFSDKYPDMGPKDERHIIQALADRDGFDVHWGTANGEDMLDLIQRPMQFEGTADLADELPVVRQATQDGIGVMLSGWGGDEGFSAKGHGVVAGLVRRGKWVKAISTLRLASRRRNPVFLAKQFINRGLLLNMPHRFARKYLGTAPDLTSHSFVKTDYKNKFKRPSFQREAHLFAGAGNVMREQIASMHIPSRMVTWSHWSLQSFQYRYPLCSQKLLEFMEHLPDEIHLADGFARFPARTAVSDILIGNHRKYDLANEERRHSTARQTLQLLSEISDSHPPDSMIDQNVMQLKIEGLIADQPFNVSLELISYIFAARAAYSFRIS